MQDARTLVWIASYPKSGNTWVRAFLANYLFDDVGAASFDAIQRVSSGDVSGPSYAELAGCPHDRIPPGRYAKVRTAHLTRIAGNGSPVNFVKTHSAHTRLNGDWLIPAALTRSAIYIVRHPLDMLVSYADHWGLSLKAAAFQIGARQNAIGATPTTAAQFLSDWSSHVKGWTRTRDFPVLTLRYEDMLADPERSFTRLIRHIGAPVDQAVMAEAIEKTSFKSLSALEAAGDFPERGPKQDRFFRSGTAGQWRDQVPGEIIDRVVADHGPTMRKLKYEV